MKPYQERVIAEKRELDDKLEKLGKFAVGEALKGMPQDEQIRLLWQFKLMYEYSIVLGQRIACFEDDQTQKNEV